MLRLFLAPTSVEMADIYKKAADAYNATPYQERNSGFDLHCTLDNFDPKYSQYAVLVSQGCKAVALNEAGLNSAFWLTPRSSISKTRYRLANSMGLIDATYRGEIKAAFNGYFHDIRDLHHQRLVQLTPPDLLPWGEVTIVDTLPAPATRRGEGGFGSTG